MNMVYEFKTLKDLHRDSFNNRELVESSATSGCFCCLEMFASSRITEWTDKGLTALCPSCGIDSVLTDSACILTDKLLHKMNLEYFNFDY